MARKAIIQKITRELPSAKQIHELSGLLGAELTNLALANVGAATIPTVNVPREVEDSTALLSELLDELKTNIRQELQVPIQPEMRHQHIEKMTRYADVIHETVNKWEKTSGYSQVRAAKALLTEHLTGAVVDAVVPQNTQTLSQTSLSGTVDAVLQQGIREQVSPLLLEKNDDDNAPVEI